MDEEEEAKPTMKKIRKEKGRWRWRTIKNKQKNKEEKSIEENEGKGGGREKEGKEIIKSDCVCFGLWGIATFQSFYTYGDWIRAECPFYIDIHT